LYYGYNHVFTTPLVSSLFCALFGDSFVVFFALEPAGDDFFPESFFKEPFLSIVYSYMDLRKGGKLRYAILIMAAIL